jgi:hypothetical protein
MLTVEINTTSRPLPLSHSLSSPSLAETGLAYIIGEVGRRVEPIPTTGKMCGFLYSILAHAEEGRHGSRKTIHQRSSSCVHTGVTV